MAMMLKFLGVRGSRPTHKAALMEFGGHSTSMEFVFEKQEQKRYRIFLDGGSGLAHLGLQMSRQRQMGQQSERCREFIFLMTHTHWDHILGLPFFDPFYDEKNIIHFFASKSAKASFTELFLGLQSSAHLPIPKHLLKAKIIFHTVMPNTSFYIDREVKISSYQLNHQGITLGYRIDYKHDSIAVLTDNAPIDNGNYMGEGMPQAKNMAFEEQFNKGLIAFLHQCHTAVFDTHFTEANLKADWGHSTPERALAFCVAAKVKHLKLFHHAPEDTDDDVRAKVASVIEAGKKQGVVVTAAKEGDLCSLR